MTIRRSIVTGCALALVLTACAGTSDGTDEPDEPAAAQSTTEDDDTATEEEGAADDAATDTDDAGADGPVESEDAHDETDEDDEAHDETEENAGDDHEDEDLAAAEDVDRVVEIDMEDIAFSAEELQFAVGERVLFRFENVGAAPHEALIGDMHVQEEHEADMAEGGGHDDGGHHDDLSMISLESGESGSFVHEFTEEGELWMGCHVPGHWGAGMKTRIVVTG